MQRGQTLIFLLVGILAIAAIGGAFYLGRSTISKPSPNPPATSQTPSPAQDANREPTGSAETTDWKTYRGKQAQYSFKYPSDWKVQEETEGCGPVFSSPDNNRIWLTVCGPYVNADDTPEAVAQRGTKPNELIFRENISLDNHNGVKQEVKKSPQHLEINVYISNVESRIDSRDISTSSKGTLGIYYYIQDFSNVDKTKAVFNQILSTFKFTQ